MRPWAREDFHFNSCKKSAVNFKQNQGEFCKDMQKTFWRVYIERELLQTIEFCFRTSIV